MYKPNSITLSRLQSDLVADLVFDLAFEKFARVCGQLATFWVESRSRRQVGELSRHVDIVRTCLRPAFDPKSCEIVADAHELVGNGNLVGNRVCDLYSVMEFGHLLTNRQSSCRFTPFVFCDTVFSALVITIN